MKILNLAKTANKNLLRAKLRTFLTVMAIFVGSFTLCLTNGIGDGLRDYVERQVKTVEGNRILFVRKKLPQELEERAKSNAPIEYKTATEDDELNGIDPNSMMISLDQLDTQRVGEYAAEDADFTWRLYRILEPQLSGSDVEPLFRDTEMPLILSTSVLNRPSCNVYGPVP